MSPVHRLPRGRRATIISAAVGAALVAGCAVLLIPGPDTHTTADTRAANSAIGDGSGAPTASTTGTASAGASASASASSSASTSAFASASASASGSATPTSSAAFSGPPKLSIGSSRTVAGTLAPAWPDQGQAEINLDGGGSIKSYGPVDSSQPIASVTKTMTAYLILHDHPLSPGQQGPSITITAADVAAYKYDVSENMSSVPVKAGEQLTENEALQALMLASADNIADVLAHWDTGTTTDDAFVSKMNSEASALGMSHTHYADASGYDPDSVSTAPDQITLAQHAMGLGYFAQLVDQGSASIPVAGTISNYNSLLGYDGVNGIKTGSTGQAGGCLLFHADFTVNGRTLTLSGAVLGQDAPTGQELGVGLAAAKTAISSTESQVTARTLIPAGTAVATAPLADGTTATLHTTGNLTVTAWPGESVTLRLSTSGTTHTLKAYASDGTLLGTTTLQ
ncbi:D-alanyl-D-alanine carboxypeptidase family protein [Actinospica robiniae]|uniref:D-alanyl-D-alanine carboxypeptidase family protein n=1 Tax=Actinospica robiniae TaxID=304901 RepID=UPI00068434BC|nr:D-alanyl-D-alanine carboxypeptidase [Actinospica robiniae]